MNFSSEIKFIFRFTIWKYNIRSDTTASSLLVSTSLTLHLCNPKGNLVSPDLLSDSSLCEISVYMCNLLIQNKQVEVMLQQALSSVSIIIDHKQLLIRDYKHVLLDSVCQWQRED